MKKVATEAYLPDRAEKRPPVQQSGRFFLAHSEYPRSDTGP